MRVALCKSLGLAPAADDAAVLAAVTALKTASNSQLPSLDKYVPRGDYDAVQAKFNAAETALNTIKSERLAHEISSAIDGAVAAGKIAPANRGFYVASCRDEGGLERFKAFVGTAPSLTGASSLAATPPASSGGELTADEKAFCSMMELDEAAYKKAR